MLHSFAVGKKYRVFKKILHPQTFYVHVGGFFGKIFSQNPIIFLFCNFCEGACHYDITEAKHWDCWYLFAIKY